jgi:hypothetical protein
MKRRARLSSPAPRVSHRSTATKFLWTALGMSVGAGANPLQADAQSNVLSAVAVGPSLSETSARRWSRWTQSEEATLSAAQKGALIGAGIGAGVALIAYEIGSRQFRFCDPADNSPTYTCTIDSRRIEAVLVGVLAGAGIGALIGSRRSTQSWTPRPFAAPRGGWGLSMSVAWGGG